MILKQIIDSFSPGPSFKLSKATVVGPYPTKDFFEFLRKNMKPSEVVLFVDDGWPNEKLNEIGECFYKKHCDFSYYRVSPKNRVGLVHAKIYLFEWTNEQQNQTKRRLLLGSANASQQGFGLHAETYVNADLLAGVQANSVLAYFNNLVNSGECDKLLLDFGGATAWLPELKLVNIKTIEQFDSWLRRGVLCHKYERDQNFAKLRLSLKKSLPAANIEKIFASDGFGKTVEANVFYRPYLSNIDLSNDEITNDVDEYDSIHNWKAQYFTETDYGHWASEDCYANYSDYFVSQNTEKWQTIVEIIQKANDDQKETWIRDYLSSVRNIFENVKQEGYAVDEYFQTSNSYLNIDFYKNLATKKIQRDSEIARSDNVFTERYISGYSFLSVPQMGSEFDEFAISLCNSLLNKSKPGNQNRLARVFSDSIFPEIINEKTGKSVLQWLRKDKNWSFVKDLILEYYAE
jgi:hypothetical protein